MNLTFLKNQKKVEIFDTRHKKKMDSMFEKRLGRKGDSPQTSPQKFANLTSPIISPRKRLLTPVKPGHKDKLGDRFIPCRAGNNWDISYNFIQERDRVKRKICQEDGADDSSKAFTIAMHSSLLENEILGTQIEGLRETTSTERRQVFAPISDCNRRNLFSYRPKRPNVINEPSSPYSISPVSSKSQKLLYSSRKVVRKTISKVPYKVLDAPNLQDDFYLNLLDWSSGNVLSVGLGACVYLWSAQTCKVSQLCDLTNDSFNDTVTSVSWSERGNHLAVGTRSGCVQIWDVSAHKKLNVLEGHSSRVGALAWKGDQLSSGSRDKRILQRDIRAQHSQELGGYLTGRGHRQEVCSLKWSPDFRYLASGGNDNKLFVWSDSRRNPVHTFTDHQAAVKALAWSPHVNGLLASGGGTADKSIRFWNTLTGQALQSINTASQVCNLAWSQHSSELVSTHGYSQNQIVLWKYPSLVQEAKLTGHKSRVLYLATSPDGESIVTGAGDETLRFWDVFSKARKVKEPKSVINLFTSIR